VKRAAVLAFVAAALALPALTRAADGPPVDEAAYEAQKEMWQGRFRAAREEVAAARVRHREARDAYAQMRHRRRDRGEEKQKILEELTASEVALEESENALTELFESARRAGVPPGWMRMERDELPAAPEPTPDEKGALP
jgi:hypothetical protein